MNELQDLAESLAQRLQRPVAIDDPQLHLLVHTSHGSAPVDVLRQRSILDRQVDDDTLAHVRSFGIDRTTDAWVRVPASDERGMVARLCAPLRTQGVLLGFLWILEPDGPLAPEALEDVVATASRAALLLHRERLLVDAERGRDRERLRDLLSDDPSVRRSAAAALRAAERVRHEDALQVMVLHVAEPEGEEVPQVVEEVLDRTARRHATPPLLSLARGDHGLLVLDGHGASPSAVAAAVRADISALLPGARIRTGVGAPVHGLEAVPTSWEQARQAVRVGHAIPGFAHDVSWPDLGVYRMLVHLPLDELPDDAVPAELLALLATSSGRELVRTVEEYLDRGGDVRSTAEALHLHRTSLYYRLGRFEQQTGLVLSRGNDRLAVHLGLKLARLAGRL